MFRGGMATQGRRGTRSAVILALAAVLVTGCTNGGDSAGSKRSRSQAEERALERVADPGDVSDTPEIAVDAPADAPTGKTTSPSAGRDLLRASRVRFTRPTAATPPSTARTTATVPSVPETPTTTVPSTPPTTTPPKDTEPGPESPDPRSTQVILAAAYESGDISYSEYMLYRAYALFWDPRLPAAFDGIGSVGEDNFFTEARHQWAKIDPEFQAELAPFLERPASTGGYGCPDGGTWQHSGDASKDFKVWSCSTGDFAADIAAVAGLLDELYPAMADPAAMGLPVRDTGSKEDGDDDRIDVYLLDVGPTRERNGQQQAIDGETVAAVSESGPFAGSTASSYLMLGRPRLDDDDELRRTAIHTFFHSLQYAHNFAITTVDPARVPWFFEASAAWAEWEYFRARSARVHNEYFIETFAAMPHVPLVQPAGVESLVAGRASRASYIWPFFMQQQAGGSPQPIFDAWKAAGNQQDWNGFHAAIDAQLPFASAFRDFTVRNLNRDLGAATAPGYDALDPDFPVGDEPTLTYDEVTTRAGPAVEHRLGGTTGAGLGPLAAQYDYTAIDPGAGIRMLTLDFSGITPAPNGDVTVLTRAPDGTWTRRDHAPGDVLTLCFDTPGQAVEELYVIVGNHARVSDWSAPSADSMAGSYTAKSTASC